MSDAAFDLKDALVDALKAAVAAALEGAPLHGVDVHESWPAKGVQGKRSVLVLDFEADERGATLRAGGGTRDATVSVDVAVAVIEYEDDARAVRELTKPLVHAVKSLVRAEGAPRAGGAFGVPGVRQPEIRRARVVEYVLDKGRRECDVHLTVQAVARVAVGA